MAEHITDLAAPPIVGRDYMVPCVEWEWSYFKARWWPVFLPLHEDQRFFRFPHQHFHVDPRFVAGNVLKSLADGLRADEPWTTFQAQPISTHRGPPAGEWVRDPGPVEWRRRRCKLSNVPYVLFGRVKNDPERGPEAICRHYAGQTAHRNRAGWVCPHQHAALGSIAPDSQGVITCPLHGLRLRASDGLCLGPPDAVVRP